MKMIYTITRKKCYITTLLIMLLISRMQEKASSMQICKIYGSLIALPCRATRWSDASSSKQRSVQQQRYKRSPSCWKRRSISRTFKVSEKPACQCFNIRRSNRQAVSAEGKQLVQFTHGI